MCFFSACLFLVEKVYQIEVGCSHGVFSGVVAPLCCMGDNVLAIEEDVDVCVVCNRLEDENCSKHLCPLNCLLTGYAELKGFYDFLAPIYGEGEAR